MLGDEVALSIQSKAVDRNVWQSSKFWDNAPLRSEILMVLTLAQSRSEPLRLEWQQIAENLGLICPRSSPKFFSGVFLGGPALHWTSPKSLPALYIYISILESDKLFLGTCVDLHLNIRNATSSRQILNGIIRALEYEFSIIIWNPNLHGFRCQAMLWITCVSGPDIIFCYYGAQYIILNWL